jgi:hypothetical protein
MRPKRVYFLRPVGKSGPVKIGCSCFPEGRLDMFTIWSPVRLELAASVPGTHADEKALHGMFRASHLHGEWFKASARLTGIIEHCKVTGALPELPKVLKFPKVRHVAHSAIKPKPVDRRAWAARMRAEYELGDDLQAVGERHGVCTVTARRLIMLAGGKMRPRGNPQRGLRDMERAAVMARRYLSGETLAAIGQDYDLTRERVRQILARMGVDRRRAA